MNIDYIYDGGDLASRTLLGIDRKVLSQVDTFNRNGISCSLVCPRRKGRLATIAQSMPLIPDRTDWLTAFDVDRDAYYIRRPVYFSKSFIDSLKHLRKQNPNAPILLEIPSWPYEREMETAKYYPVLIKDRLYRKRLSEFVDRIVDLSGTHRIFDIPTIQIINGIDLANTPKRTPKSVGSCANLLSVAIFSEWHGIDRLIRGLAAHCKDGSRHEVKLHLVGDGPAIKGYRDLVSKLGITDNVLFYGRMKPEEFSHLYDECDLAIECLGNHRKDASLSSSLKSREYLAKGIPFIYSGDIDVFCDEPVDFCLQLPADESPIDFGQVINFRNWLYNRESPAELASRIRAYAERHVSMDVAMAPVISYLKEVIKKHD